MLPSTTVAIRGLGLWYNKSDIRYTFCSKRFRVFLEGQGYKDKPTPLPPIKTYSFDWGPIILFTHVFAVFILYKCNYKSSVRDINGVQQNLFSIFMSQSPIHLIK